MIRAKYNYALWLKCRFLVRGAHHQKKVACVEFDFVAKWARFTALQSVKSLEMIVPNVPNLSLITPLSFMYLKICAKF